MASKASVPGIAGRYPLEDIQQRAEFRDDVWLLEKWRPSYMATKRACDVAVGVILFVLFVVSLPIVAIAIKCDSRGPVFYLQERVGLREQRFRIIKYRSMEQDAEKLGARFASLNDSRITRVGTVLRRTRLDELPQVINVLLGHMSVVGPRPERPHVVAAMSQVAPAFAMRTLVRPGLTGYAQVHAHYAASEAELLTKLEYDLYYIRHASLFMDLKIIARTVVVVFRQQGT